MTANGANSLILMNCSAFHLTVIVGVDLVTTTIAWIFDIGEAQLRRLISHWCCRVEM